MTWSLITKDREIWVEKNKDYVNIKKEWLHPSTQERVQIAANICICHSHFLGVHLPFSKVSYRTEVFLGRHYNHAAVE